MTSVTQSTTHRTISPRELQRGLAAGANHLLASREVLDRLNVFPVPDGDTGHNMVATYTAGTAKLDGWECDSIRALGDRVVPPMTRESRGNSGFILARFFDGFFAIAGAADHLDAETFSAAFAEGSFRVTTSLMDPVEGTALTILSAMAAEMAASVAEGAGDAIDAFKRAVAAGRDALFTTPELLPILAKAGVVDSGALGFLVLCDGVIAGIEEVPVAPESEAPYRFPPRAVEVDDEAATRFRYCTELVLSAFSGPSPAEIREFLSQHGDSIALYTDETVVKLHIHTNDPDAILAYLSPFGAIETQKVEDMHAQIRAAKAISDGGGCGVLTIVPGDGFARVFRDLGIADALVFGETLPASGEIADAIEAVSADNVIVLPNDRNIVPAASLAAESVGKHVTILPTTTVVHGLSAAYGFSENAPTSDNIAAMSECEDLAEAFAVHRAGESATFGETDIPEGHFFVAREGSIVAHDTSLSQTVLTALQAGTTPIEERANVTLFTGTAMDDEAVSEVVSAATHVHPHLEVEALPGGQSRAVIIVSVE